MTTKQRILKELNLPSDMLVFSDPTSPKKDKYRMKICVDLRYIDRWAVKPNLGQLENLKGLSDNIIKVGIVPKKTHLRGGGFSGVSIHFNCMPSKVVWK